MTGFYFQRQSCTFLDVLIKRKQDGKYILQAQQQPWLPVSKYHFSFLPSEGHGKVAVFYGHSPGSQR